MPRNKGLGYRRRQQRRSSAETLATTTRRAAATKRSTCASFQSIRTTSLRKPLTAQSTACFCDSRKLVHTGPCEVYHTSPPQEGLSVMHRLGASDSGEPVPDNTIGRKRNAVVRLLSRRAQRARAWPSSDLECMVSAGGACCAGGRVCLIECQRSGLAVLPYWLLSAPGNLEGRLVGPLGRLSVERNLGGRR